MNLKAVTINEKPEPKKNKQFSGGFLPTQVTINIYNFMYLILNESIQGIGNIIAFP